MSLYHKIKAMNGFKYAFLKHSLKLFPNRKLFCPIPFKYMEIGSGGKAILCCYLKKSAGVIKGNVDCTHETDGHIQGKITCAVVAHHGDLVTPFDAQGLECTYGRHHVLSYLGGIPLFYPPIDDIVVCNRHTAALEAK